MVQSDPDPSSDCCLPVVPWGKFPNCSMSVFRYKMGLDSISLMGL